MELTAVIKAIILIKGNKISNSTIITDSQYVYKGITSWMSSWKKRGWKNSFKEPIANLDLWLVIDKLLSDSNLNKGINFEWIKGHSGIYGNEMADKLAVEGIKKI
jgi:ribonuclease HI